MDHLEELTGALVEAMVESVVAGFDASAGEQEAMRARGAQLRDGAAMLALFGPRLFKLSRAVLGEVERRSVPRYAACLDHVRYSTDALINELEDARATLNVAVLAAERSPGSMQTLQVALAIVRVRAVTLALGQDCVATAGRAARKGGPELRRRAIDAADIAPEVAAAILAMTASDGDWIAGIAALHAMEPTPTNTGGIVTSLIALAEQDDGRAFLNGIATRLQRARYDRAKALPVARTPSVQTPAPTTAVPPPLVARSEVRQPTERATTGPPARAGVDTISERFRKAGTRKMSARERLQRSQAAHAGKRE